MANFQTAPESLLKRVPHTFSSAWQTVLKRPGTYSLFDSKDWRFVVPNVEIGGEKGVQSRLIAMWGGQEGGHRLQVEADPPIRGVDVALVSETPVAEHLWLWCVTARYPACLVRQISTDLVGVTTVATPGKPVGTADASRLPLIIAPETPNSAHLPPWAGGSQDETRDAIIAECQRQGVALDTQVAYLLATADHESGFRPIREHQFGHHTSAQATEGFRRRLRYYPYYGRGYVQLTWKRNYRSYGARLAVDLVNDPDLALHPAVALYVLVHGVMHGSFGAPLTRFVNHHRTDFLHARQSVNAMSGAQHIAGIAHRWLGWLRRHRPGAFHQGPNPPPLPPHQPAAHPQQPHH